MKKILLLIALTFCFTGVEAQSIQLGNFISNQWLDNYFYSNYKIISGGYDSRNDYYPNTTFVGYTSSTQNPRVEVKSDRNGCVDVITLTFSNIKSEQEIRNIVNNYITGYKASILEKTDENNRLYIRCKLPSSRMNYWTMNIQSAWDYNSFGDFFFYRLVISFL